MHFDLLSIDQNCIETLGKKSSKTRATPIVLSRHWACKQSKILGQAGPEYDCIQVARVVSEIDALTRFWLRAEPSNREATHQLGEES